MRRTFMLKDREATERWGRALGTLVQPGDVLALVGDLGAGKTWLTRAIALGMGIRDEVTSPTFTLVHEYRGAVPMFHLDTYRLERPEDLFDLGFEDYLQRQGVIVIEWADRVSDLLPPERLTLTLQIVGEGEDAARRLTASTGSDRYEQLLQALSEEPGVGCRVPGAGKSPKSGHGLEIEAEPN